MGKINVGFIGCGRISDLHYLGYRNNPDARLAAVCDTNPDIVTARKKQWKADRGYTDYRELLRDPKIDAVEILTPHSMHEAMVVEAAAAGKHISLQKPMTMSLQSADRMIAAAARNNVLFKVTDNYAWYPPFVLAKQMIENGDIGKPVTLSIKLIVGGSGGWEVPASSWEWRMKDFSMGFGEETFDHGHHLWTTAWFLLGEVDLVKAWVDSLDGILDTPSVVMWKYRDGVKYGICENAAATAMTIPSKYYANDEWVEITGTHGIITVNRCNGNIKTGPPVSLFNGKKWKQYNTRCDWSEGFIDSTKNFVNALKGNEKPRLSGQEGRDILKFSLAIIRSATTRREVYLDELDVRFPRWYHWNRRRIEKRDNPLRPKKGGLFGGGGTAKYAPQAAGLTEGLMERFDPSAVVGWNTVIGLALLPEGNIKAVDYTVTVQNGRAELKRGEIDKKAVMTIRVQAGVWAALLLKKKRLEMAYIQGKLKIEGRAEEALKLREAFKL